MHHVVKIHESVKNEEIEMNLNMLVCWCLERSALCINSQINTEVSTRFRRTYFLLLLCNCFASSRKLNPKLWRVLFYTQSVNTSTLLRSVETLCSKGMAV